jgi:hypothetical protein
VFCSGDDQFSNQLGVQCVREQQSVHAAHCDKECKTQMDAAKQSCDKPTATSPKSIDVDHCSSANNRAYKTGYIHSPYYCIGRISAIENGGGAKG